VQNVEEDGLMIAHQAGEGCKPYAHVQKVLNTFSRIWTSVNDVAEKDNLCVSCSALSLLIRYFLDQPHQQVEAAMHVADRIDTLPHRYRRAPGLIGAEKWQPHHCYFVVARVSAGQPKRSPPFPNWTAHDPTSQELTP
jgi:hypothetical protein